VSHLSPPTPEDDRWDAEHPSANGASARVAGEGVHRVVVLGYITAFSMPPIGFVIGLILAIRSDRPNSRHGLWIIIVSVIASIVWIAVLSSGALNTTTGDY
jgi:hypothetical protein